MKHVVYPYLTLLLCACSVAPRMSRESSSQQTTSIEAPVAKMLPQKTILHGDIRTDNYAWLQNKNDPQVLSYLGRENAYTQRIMSQTEQLQKKLYQEFIARVQETDESLPVFDRGYYYYERTQQGLQYPIVCRKKASLSAQEQIVLDLNQMAKGKKYFALGTYRISDNGQLMAYVTDITGFRQFSLYVREVDSAVAPKPIIDKVTSFGWAQDNQTLFYTVEDSAKRPYRLYRHQLGQSTSQDQLMFEETDKRFRISIQRSKDRKFLFLNVNSHTTSEVRFLRADRPLETFALIEPRKANQKYQAYSLSNRFLILTNDTGVNNRVVVAPLDNYGRKGWQELIGHSTEVMQADAEVFKDYLVLYQREQGSPQIMVVPDYDLQRAYRVRMPESVYAIYRDNNPDFLADSFRFEYRSPLIPKTTYQVNSSNGQLTLLKRSKVLGDYDPSNYSSKRIWATASDGVRIPISIVHHKQTPLDGSAPTFLTGYGSYGANARIYFSPPKVSLLDRGMVVAIAHVRGGGELGKNWHIQGRMFQKKNTFTDFIASANHLIQQRIAHPRRIIASGGSAGGLLVTAAANIQPDLFRAMLIYVPFVDVLNTMLDSNLPLTVGEYEEWGDPRIKQQYQLIKSYCPYTNIKRVPYPAMLIRTAFYDSQVMYWEPAKYVAKLRTHKTDQNPLLLLTNLAAGHGGASGRYDRYKDTAFDYAFVLWQAGIKQ